MKPDFKLPFWMDGPRATAVANTSKRYWGLAESYVRLPLATFDVMTCAIGFVNLIAYQRGIDRFAGESEGFYRLRVHHALRNAIAAGTPNGMSQIFNNLELPEAEYIERAPEYDWDTTRVLMSGRRFVALETQIRFVLGAYWRTCRRYHIALKTDAQTIYGPANIASGNSQRTAQLKPNTLQARSLNSLAGLANTLNISVTKHRSFTL